jgi:hypothetical protein
MVRITVNSEDTGEITQSEADNAEQALDFMFNHYARSASFILESFQDHDVRIEMEVYREQQGWSAESWAHGDMLRYVHRPTRKTAIMDCLTS